jgi:hypothetical protein
MKVDIFMALSRMKWILQVYCDDDQTTLQLLTKELLIC